MSFLGPSDAHGTQPIQLVLSAKLPRKVTEMPPLHVVPGTYELFWRQWEHCFKKGNPGVPWTLPKPVQIQLAICSNKLKHIKTRNTMKHPQTLWSSLKPHEMPSHSKQTPADKKVGGKKNKGHTATEINLGPHGRNFAARDQQLPPWPKRSKTPSFESWTRWPSCHWAQISGTYIEDEWRTKANQITWSLLGVWWCFFLGGISISISQCYFWLWQPWRRVLSQSRVESRRLEEGAGRWR